VRLDNRETLVLWVLLCHGRKKYGLVVMVPSCITDQSIFILMLFSLIEIIMQV
jgi:hypothetical protein